MATSCSRAGKKATYYVDLRKVSLDHRVAPLIGQVMLDLIAGVPAGERRRRDDSWAPTRSPPPCSTRAPPAEPLYDAFVVRKEPKDHGRGRQVEGPDLERQARGRARGHLDDGGSPLSAIDALEKVGATIAAVAVVVDRDTGARERIEAAGYPYFAAIGLADLGLVNEG